MYRSERCRRFELFFKSSLNFLSYFEIILFLIVALIQHEVLEVLSLLSFGLDVFVRFVIIVVKLDLLRFLPDPSFHGVRVLIEHNVSFGQ